MDLGETPDHSATAMAEASDSAPLELAESGAREDTVSADDRKVSVLDRVATFTDEGVAFIRDNSAAICLALTLSGIATFSILFGSLAVENHRNYGTWAYDGAIYDQAIWLVSRGERRS